VFSRRPALKLIATVFTPQSADIHYTHISYNNNNDVTSAKNIRSVHHPPLADTFDSFFGFPSVGMGRYAFGIRESIISNNNKYFLAGRRL